MTSRIVKSAFTIGRLRFGAATAAEANNGSRLTFSTQISKSAASVSPANAFVRTWYNMYVTSFLVYVVDFPRFRKNPIHSNHLCSCFSLLNLTNLRYYFVILSPRIGPLFPGTSYYEPYPETTTK